VQLNGESRVGKGERVGFEERKGKGKKRVKECGC